MVSFSWGILRKYLAKWSNRNPSGKLNPFFKIPGSAPVCRGIEKALYRLTYLRLLCSYMTAKTLISLSVQSNLNSSNTGGSFTMGNSNSFLSHIYPEFFMAKAKRA